MGGWIGGEGVGANREALDGAERSVGVIVFVLHHRHDVGYHMLPADVRCGCGCGLSAYH